MPSLDRLLGHEALRALIDAHGRPLATEAARAVLAELRGGLPRTAAPDEATIAAQVAERLAAMTAPGLRRVRNLTGTVLHTNLGRAPLPPEAIAAMSEAAATASNVEYDLENGRRGDRDSHVEDWLRRLTGAEAATVVNNNTAAVLLTLNSLALRRQVVVSRGELIEIGGAFRLPDIMSRAGSKLCEVGTTNRTHAADYETAITSRTALLLKVHTSNYRIEGFTAAVEEARLAALAHDHDLPLVVDLGSGTLVPLGDFGLPDEPTVAAMLRAGADLVTFSGDKLLGGPQAGIVVGREDLVQRLKRNPLKRALRVDKLTLAALGALLPLYADPARLKERLPALTLLTRPQDEIHAQAKRLAPLPAATLSGQASVSVAACASQVGSGALPVDTLPSAALVLHPLGPRKRAPGMLRDLAAAFRALPTPAVGRVHDGALWLDLRCLDDEAGFAADLAHLTP